MLFMTYAKLIEVVMMIFPSIKRLKGKSALKNRTQAYLLAASGREEVLRPHFLAEHNVVVHVYIEVRQSWYSVNVTLNSRRAERGQVTLIREELLKNVKMVTVKLHHNP